MKTYRTWEWSLPALTFAVVLGIVVTLVGPLTAEATDGAFRSAAAQTDVTLSQVWTRTGAYDFVYAGKGVLKRKAGASTLTLEIPGNPVAAFLYIAGSDIPNQPGRHFPAGDTKVTVVVRNASGTRTYTDVAVPYHGGSAFINRLDISGDVVQGTNAITISKYNLNHPEGAVAIAVYETGGTERTRVELFEGADAGYYPKKPPIGPDSEVILSSFDAADSQREGRVVMALCGLQNNRGDEVFLYNGQGAPGAGLADTDGDGLIDIVDRAWRLRAKDLPPFGNDWADRAKLHREAVAGAVSLEEDRLGRLRKRGGFGAGAELDLFETGYTIPAGSTYSGFQVQSENPENGDSFILFLLANAFPVPEGFNPLPNINVTKTPQLTQGAPGLQVDFTFTVTALGGDEALRDVTVADDPLLPLTGPAGDTDGDGRLDLDETWTYTGSRVYPEVGQFPDTVTAVGYGVESGLEVRDTDDALVVVTVPPGSIGDFVWSDLNSDGVQDPGEPGLAGVAVTLSAGGGAPPLPLAAVTNANGYYLFTGLTAGDYAVTVDPTTLPAGMAPTFDYDGTATPHTASLTLGAGESNLAIDFGYHLPRPDFTIEKTASIESGFPGDPVTYEFTVRNTGEVKLVDIAVSDDKLGDLGLVTLEVGAFTKLYKRDYPLPGCLDLALTEETLCDGTTVVLDRCSDTNVVTAVWGDLSRWAKDCVEIKKRPDFTIEKTASIESGFPGDPVTYEFTVRNTGEVKLVDIAVSDDKLGDLGLVTLEVGAFTKLYKRDHPLPDCGLGGATVDTTCGGQTSAGNRCSLRNTVTATWDVLTRTAWDCVDIVKPGIDIVKTVAPAEGYPNDTVTYTFTVTNTGAVTLYDVKVTDPKLNTAAPHVIKTIAVLEPGAAAAVSFTKTFKVPFCADSRTETGACSGAPSCGGASAPSIGGGAEILGFTQAVPDCYEPKLCHMTNIATVVGSTSGGRQVTDNDDACLTILPYKKLGDFAWYDMDRDGVQDPGEPGIAGVQMTVRKSDGSPSGGVGNPGTTNGAGRYSYYDLRHGAFDVSSTVPAGYQRTTPGTLRVDLSRCQMEYLDADFGFWIPPQIAVTKQADPTFGYLSRSVGPWPGTLVFTPLEVTYTFAVSNPGVEPLKNVAVSDAVSGNPQCADPVRTIRQGTDEILDHGEIWTFQQTCVYAEVGTFPDTVTATGWGKASNQKVEDDASASVETAACGVCAGKVATLTLRYDGTVAGAHIEVKARDSAFGSANVAFDGIVQPGGEFSFGPLPSANGGFDGTLGTEVSVYVNGELQTKVHTSCSQPIDPGSVWGDFTVLEGTSKAGGALCPYGEQ